MYLSSEDVQKWRDQFKKGTTKPLTAAESAALLDEVLSLRKQVRRMEDRVLKATQTSLFKPDGER